jgi:hypothetical protein
LAREPESPATRHRRALKRCTSASVGERVGPRSGESRDARSIGAGRSAARLFPVLFLSNPYTDTITVSDPAGLRSPRNVPVTLTVQPPSGSLSVSITSATCQQIPDAPGTARISATGTVSGPIGTGLYNGLSAYPVDSTRARVSGTWRGTNRQGPLLLGSCGAKRICRTALIRTLPSF